LRSPVFRVVEPLRGRAPDAGGPVAVGQGSSAQSDPEQVERGVGRYARAMLFLLTGAAGSGKSAALQELSGRRSDLAVFDLDDLRPPSSASRSWWRAQIGANVLRAVQAEEDGRDTVLAGWTTIEEVVGPPSAAALEGVAACLFDCNDDVRGQRVERRAASGTWRL